jgi:CHAT domain-containing protein/tetratricopeptide (TPR) repeat protein
MGLERPTGTRHVMGCKSSRLRKFASVSGMWLLFAGAVVSLPTSAATDGNVPCNAALQSGLPIEHWELVLGTARTAVLSVTLPANRSVLLVAHEVGVDVDLELSTPTVVAARAGNPVRRNGVLRILLHTDSSGRATVRVRAMADGGLGSRVTMQAFDNEVPDSANCQSVVEALAAGDSAFARARLISVGWAAPNAGSAADLYNSAYRNYIRAFDGLAPENLGLRAEVAHALAALLCKDIGLWPEGDHWSAVAASLLEKEGDDIGRANAESLQAITWMELAQLPDAATAADPVRRDSHALAQQALRQLRRLAAHYEKQAQFFDAAEQLNFAGLTLYNMGEYNLALASYRRAQALYERLGERYGLALVLQNTALADWDLGRTSTALNIYARSLSLVDPADAPSLYALILDNEGLANRTAGHLDNALALHTQALDVTSRIQDETERGRNLFGIGLVYSAAGDRAMAANFLRQALDISARKGEGRDLVSVLRALAMIEAQDGHRAEAIRLDREALAHATSPIVRAHLLTQIADAESLLGANRAAADDLALARSIPRADDAVSRALVQFESGVLDYRAGRLARARTQLQAARAIDRAFDLDAAAFDTDVALARVDIAAGDSKQALRHLDAGLKLSEVLRLQVSDPELRATSMQPLRPAFDLKVELLSRAYRQAVIAGDVQGADGAARAALAATERSRSRVMRDIAVSEYPRGTATQVDQLLSRKSQLLGDMAAHEDRLEAGGVRSMTDPRIIAIRADVAHLREQLAVLDSQLANLSRSAKGASHGVAGAVGELPSAVAIISYWLGSSEAYAWLQTQSRVRLIDLGPADTLRNAAEAAHAVYNRPDGASLEARLQAGARLSRLVLQPVLSQVPAGISQLIIVPDGPLHYVSFAALPMRVEADTSFLIEKYDVAYGASIAAVLAPNTQLQPADGMLLVADAVYGRDDPRLGQAQTPGRPLAPDQPRLRSAFNMAALDRLPATGAEAAAIAQIAAPLTVDRLEGFEATREAVLSRPLERYRYIHFAVHATTDAEIPQLSSLVLSTYDAGGHPLEDRIWAGDLMGRRFNARIVVLSACDTALGRDIGGEGLFGLRYVVLARGAQSVVASLWAVPDRSTATLMQAFYKGLLLENRRPESALALAMRQMLRQGPRDPVFWAPFTATIASLNEVAR